MIQMTTRNFDARSAFKSRGLQERIFDFPRNANSRLLAAPQSCRFGRYK
jgi:hypothetical protein